MARFLSEEWVAAFNAATAGVTLTPPGDDAGLAARSGSFTVGQIVAGGPEGEIHTLLRVTDGVTLERVAGAGSGTPADEPDVTVRLDWDDAVAMATGRLPVAEALGAGRIRVRGDLSVLAAGHAALAEIQPHLEPLHAATTY